jgi:hypothetical protein
MGTRVQFDGIPSMTGRRGTNRDVDVPAEIVIARPRRTGRLPIQMSFGCIPTDKTTLRARVRMIVSLTVRVPGLGSSVSFRMVDIFSGCSSLGCSGPVSTGCSLMCVGTSVNVVEKGTTKTVLARGWEFRPSAETTSMGRELRPLVPHLLSTTAEAVGANSICRAR